MRQLKAFAIVMLMGLAAGCSSGSATRLDASSEDALKNSMEQIRKSMTEEQQRQFAADCIAATVPEIMKNAQALALAGKAKPSGLDLFKPLNGFTASEIHEKAEQARAKLPTAK